MLHMLIFGEFIDSNMLSEVLQKKLVIVNSLDGLGTYLQGIAQQNTVDFIWGTDSGTRSLLVALLLNGLKFIGQDNWTELYELISIISPFFGFLLAFRLLKKINIFVVIASLLYAGNPWIVSRLLSGFWQLNSAYALLPFMLTIPLMVIKKEKTSWRTYILWSSIYAIMASVIFSSQPHFLLIVSLFLTLHMGNILIKKEKKASTQLGTFYGFSILIFCFLTSYIIIPSIIYPEKFFTAPDQYFSLGSVKFNGAGAQLQNILRLSPLTFPFTPIVWNIKEYIQLIPMIGIVILFFVTKKKNWLLMVCLMIMIFLAKGLNPPLQQLSEFLYQNIPILHFFRDPPRFIAGITLFGCSIIAMRETTKGNLSGIKPIIYILTASIIIIIANNSFLEESKNVMTTTTIPTEYVSMQKVINQLPTTQQRIMTLPNSHGLKGYPFYNNKTTPAVNTIWEVSLPLKIPLANSSNYPDNYSSQFSSYAYHTITSTNQENLIYPLGVKYIVVDQNIIQSQTEKDIATSSASRLRQNPGITKIKEIKQLSLWMVKNASPLVTTQKPIFAIGDFATIEKIKEKTPNRPVILLNQEVNAQQIIPSLLKNEELIADTANPILTLSAESLSNTYAVDILSPVWNYDKSFVNGEPYKMSAIKETGTLFTSGRAIQSTLVTKPTTFTIKTQPGISHLLIKVLTTLPNTTLQLRVNQKKFDKTLNTNKKLIWIDLGPIKVNTKTTITLVSDGQQALMIDYIVIVPEKVWIQKNKEIATILQNMHTVSMTNIQEQPEKLNYTITQDHISLKNNATYVTYRLTWGQQWTSNAQAVKYISDGYGMTFIASRKNLHDLLYPPNKLYQMCFNSALIGYILLIIYITYTMVKRGIARFR